MTATTDMHTCAQCGEPVDPDQHVVLEVHDDHGIQRYALGTWDCYTTFVVRGPADLKPMARHQSDPPTTAT